MKNRAEFHTEKNINLFGVKSEKELKELVQMDLTKNEIFIQISN